MSTVEWSDVWGQIKGIIAERDALLTLAIERMACDLCPIYHECDLAYPDEDVEACRQQVLTWAKEQG
jgi:hypothetical protein